MPITSFLFQKQWSPCAISSQSASLRSHSDCVILQACSNYQFQFKLRWSSYLGLHVASKSRLCPAIVLLMKITAHPRSYFRCSLSRDANPLCKIIADLHPVGNGWPRGHGSATQHFHREHVPRQAAQLPGTRPFPSNWNSWTAWRKGGSRYNLKVTAEARSWYW